MEKDIGKIKKNDTTDIIIRLDDFGGRPGLTIREHVVSERYTGFTKAGTRIPADKFADFKKAIDSIKESDFHVSGSEMGENTKPRKEISEPSEDSEENEEDYI